MLVLASGLSFLCSRSVEELHAACTRGPGSVVTQSVGGGGGDSAECSDSPSQSCRREWERRLSDLCRKLFSVNGISEKGKPFSFFS